MQWGETHLLIAPNSEHSLASAVPELVETLNSFIKSIAAGDSAEARPSFDYTYDNATGGIEVKITSDRKPSVVQVCSPFDCDPILYFRGWALTATNNLDRQAWGALVWCPS